jgi:O-antigen/teichoic acid export membrane protein
VETIREIGQRVAANASVLLLTDIVGKLIRAAFAIYAARVLGVQRFGMYTLAVTFVFFFEFVCRFGLGPMAVREIARHREQVERFVSNILILLLVSAAVACGLLLLSLPLFNYEQEVKVLIFFLVPTLFTNALSSTFSTVAYGFENMKLPSLISIGSDFLTSSFGIVALSRGRGPVALVGVVLVVSMVNAGVAGWCIHRYFRVSELSVDLALCGWLLKRSLPFGVLTLLLFLHDKVDILMLSRIPGPLDGNQAIGYYTPAYSILAAFMMLPASLRMAMVPVLAAQKDSLPIIHASLEGSTKFLCAFLSFPLVIITTFFAKDLITLVFGETYLPTADALRILGWAYALNMATAPAFALLSTAGNLWRYVPWAIGIVSLNVLLNVFLIPVYSFIGAAVATLVTESMAWFLRLYFLRKIVGIQFSDARVLFDLLVPMGITFGLVHFISSTYHFHSLVLVLWAAAIYFTALAGFKVFTKEELSMLKPIARRLVSTNVFRK